MFVVDSCVPFNSATTTAMNDYASAVEGLQQLAVKLSYWTTRARARVPGAFGHLSAVRAQYQGCIMQLRVMAAAPISWPYSKVLLSLKSIQGMLQHFTTTHFNVSIKTVNTPQKVNSDNVASATGSSSSASDEGDSMAIEIEDQDDDVDMYVKFQERSRMLEEFEKEQRRLDDDFIVDDVDGLYGGHGQKRKRRRAPVASHPTGGLQQVEARGGRGDQEKEDEERKESADDIKAMKKKRDPIIRVSVCATLDDVIAAVQRVIEAVSAFEDILEEQGVCLLTDLLPTPSQW